jgi:tetratricopeptide (TPR) repeat protein
LRQVLIFLREQKDKTKDHPEVWAYWQQRVGNEIGNQLYKEGDYVNALEVYLDLAQIDPAPAWRLPVDYQVGITYERLLQPQKAVETYNEILTHETALCTNATPGLKGMLDMARWRIGFLAWQDKAETDIHPFAGSKKAGTGSATNASAETITQ